MKKILVALMMFIGVSTYVNAQTTLELSCGTRTLSNDFLYPEPNIVRHNIFSYRATECGTRAEHVFNEWSVSGAVAYGSLSNDGSFGQIYMSGNGDHHPVHLVAGHSLIAQMGVSREVTPWLSLGGGITLDYWKHNSGLRFIPTDPTIFYFMHDTYIAPQVTVRVQKTVFKRLNLTAAASGYLAHRVQKVSYDEATYMLNSESHTSGWDTGTSVTIGARVALTQRLGLQASYERRVLRTGSVADPSLAYNKETFHTSRTNVGLSIKL